MSSILKKLSVAFGAAIFIVVASIGFVREVPFLVIMYRGIIAMSVSTVVFLAFAYFFQKLLFRFVAEQIMTQKGSPAAGQGEKRILGDSMQINEGTRPGEGADAARR